MCYNSGYPATIRNSSERSVFSIHLFKTILSTSYVKFIRPYINNKLSFYLHIDHVCKNSVRVIFASVDLLIAAYYWIIHQCLSYGLPIWGIESSRTKFILRLQQKALITIFRIPRRESCENLLQHVIFFFNVYSWNPYVFNFFKHYLPFHINNTEAMVDAL